MDGSEDIKQAADPSVSESEEKVIEIGWQVLLIPLIVLTVAGGYYAGRFLRGNALADSSLDPAFAGAPAIGTPVINSNPAFQQAPVIITIDPNQLAGGAGSQQARPLRPSTHHLMGQPAPDFEMTRLDTGEPLSVSSLLGKTVMINFWATWCPPCRYEMPWLEAMYAKFGGEDFELLAVDAGEKVAPDQVDARVRQFVDRMGLTFPVLMGDNTYNVQRDYGVYGLPATFVIDPEGTVVHHHGGMYPNEATIEAQLRPLLGLDLSEDS